MTNREVMIMALQGKFDDYGTEEALIYYNVNCPYLSGDERCECNYKETTREVCSECKYKWLDSEVDE